MEHKYEASETVQDKEGVRGHIERRMWLVDMKKETPAQPVYIVRFDDGRVKQCTEDELQPA